MPDEIDQIQLNLLDQDNSLNEIGCCSHYRECSDLGSCVMLNASFSDSCAYRKNLMNSVIFYGKNATHFSKKKYSEIVEQINDLPKMTRTIFDNLVIGFCEYHRGANRLIVRNEYIAKLSSVGLFDFVPLGAEFPRICSYNSFLRPRLTSYPVFKLAQNFRAEALKPMRDAIKAAETGSEEEKRLKKEFEQLQKELPSEKSQEFMTRWLNHEGIKIRDYLAKPYRVAICNPGTTSYLEEYYRDTLSSGYESRIYSRSPLAEDRLLSPWDIEEEELRRVRLSHGYSANEKAYRIEAIESSRANRKSKKEDPGPTLVRKATDSAAKLSKQKPQNLFLGKMCVITGNLSRPRADALFDILKCGGYISDSPVNTMDILIIGSQDWSEQNNGIASRKIQKAADLHKRGVEVLILSEDEFNSALADAFASV